MDMMMSEALRQRGVAWFNSVDSTNAVAKRLAREGAAHGALVLAERQTDGRGRRGRNWQSPPGRGIWMSLIARADVASERASDLTFVAALACCRAVEDECGQAPMIKWPNDLVMGGKKICGMLLEMQPEGGRLGFAVIGVGINALGLDFPEDLPHAGSIEGACGVRVGRARLVEAFLRRFDELFANWLAGGLSALMPAYRERSCTLGRDVLAICPDGEVRGFAEGIAPDGALLLRLPDGALRPLYAGDVSVRGLFGYA